LRIKNKELEYLTAYYQQNYPELEQTTIDFNAEITTDDTENISLPEEKYYKLSQAEYEELEPAQKNQMALDRYWNKRKTKWVIGRDYERYIGYKFEKEEGYSVIYQGINERFEDRGIDLICKKKDEVLLVQCKYWKQGFLIRENAVNQLYGTGEKYRFDESKRNIMFGAAAMIPIRKLLITSSELSDTAREYAKVLGVGYIENQPLEKYPIIKCNVSADGTKIYHLPFDQQYDKTIIEPWKGEFYAMTIKEAEDKGFRRAYRWKGNK
jgi:hypothetical protein